jgi:hypothetical protein
MVTNILLTICAHVITICWVWKGSIDGSHNSQCLQRRSDQMGSRIACSTSLPLGNILLFQVFGLSRETCPLLFFWTACFFLLSKFATGPEPDDYLDAMCVDGEGIGQRMMYGKKGHGVIVLTFMFPNGIHYFYGPVSYRRNEKQILTWSGVDNLLYDMQSEIGNGIYAGMGDKIFNIAAWSCIKIVPTHPQSERQSAEKNEMNKNRVSIEWDYGAAKALFKGSNDRESKRLDNDSTLSLQELLVCGLLKNCHTCFNGNTASGFRTFNCDPPTLEQYLYPVPKPVPNPQNHDELQDIVGDPLYN